MPTNDEIFKQLNLSDADKEWVTTNAAQYNKKNFNRYRDDPKAENLLDAIDGVSTHITSQLDHSVTEREGGRRGGYETKDSGNVTVSDRIFI